MQTQQQNKSDRSTSAWLRWLNEHRPRDEGFPPSKRLWHMLRGALLGAAAWVLCQSPLLFSVNPLGIALLCAVDRQVGWVLIGLLLGLWQSGQNTLWYAACAILAVFLRLLCRLFFTPAREGDTMTPQELRRLYIHRRWSQLCYICHRGGRLTDGSSPEKAASFPALPPLYDEPVGLRVMASLLCALLPCLGIPAAGGFAFYDLYGAIFYLLLTPIATALFAMALHADTAIAALPDKLRAYAPVWQWLGSAALLMSICYCGRDLSFLGISPVIALTVLLVVLAVRRHGLGGGLGVSLLCGVACDPLTIPLYLCIGIPYALLHPVIGGLSLLPAALSAFPFTLLAGGTPLFLAMAPSLAVGVLLLSVIRRLQDKVAPLTQSTNAPDSALHRDSTLRLLLEEQSRNNAITDRLSAVAGTFSSLAEVFRQCSETMQRPGVSELRHLCDEVYDDYCPDCPHKETCWTSEYGDTLASIHALSRALANDKPASEDCLSPALRRRCSHTRTILSDINYRVSRRSFELLHGAQSEQFAQSYDAISHLLRDILRQERERSDHADIDELSDAVARYLQEKSITARHVYVSGEGQKQLRLLGVTPAALTIPKEDFRNDLSRILGAPVSRLHFDGSEDGTISLTTLPRLRADYVHRSVAANERGAVRQAKRTVCGDTLRLFEGERGMFYALLCDGMGNGRNAALTSGICSVFLERVLRTGISVHTALRMLNHYLLSRTTSPEEECSSTVDLFELDLYSGKARFIKSGAAPSLILRDGRLFRLSSHTVPIGILHAIDAQVIPFEVQPGDHILLMSDGITDTADDTQNGETDWLTDYLSSTGSSSAATSLLQDNPPPDESALIDAIFAQARARGSDDDMSIISIHISSEQD